MFRDKPTVNLISPKSSTTTPIIKQTIKCGQCVTEEAKVKCVECVENYCAVCYNQFHLRGALQRHHRIFLSESQLSTSPRKTRSFNSEVNIRDLFPRQSNDDLHRKSTITSSMRGSDELRNLKTNYTSVQNYSFSKWRNNYVNKSIPIRPRNGLITPISETTIDRIDYFNRLPNNIDFNSSRIPSNEMILSKRDQSIDKTNQKKSIRQSKKTKTKKKDEPKIGVMINIYYALTENTHLNDPSIDIEPFDENKSEVQTGNSEQVIETEEPENKEPNVEHVEEQERPVTHISSKSDAGGTSPPPKKSSMTIMEESLRSLLATKSTDELEAIVNCELILSQSILSSIDDYELSSNLSSQNQIVQKPIPDDTSIESTVIDHYPVAHFDSSLNDLSYESKIVSTNQLSNNSSTNKIERNPSTTVQRFSSNSSKATKHRNSPFSFTNPSNQLHRVNSTSSIEASDDCFFTDVLPQEKIPSARIFSSKQQKEPMNVSHDQLTEQNSTTLNSSSKPKLSTKISVSKDSKHSLKLEESQLGSKFETNRVESSLSSASLPVSIQSSKMDFNYPTSDSSATSSRRSSSSSTSSNSSTSIQTTTKSSSSKTSSSTTTTLTSTKLSQLVSTSNNSSATKPMIHNSSLELETVPTIVMENTKIPSSVTNEKSIQEPINSSRAHIQQNSNDLSTSNSPVKQTENETHVTNKEKSHHRQIINSEELSKFRKLEFSMEDGLKWQAASAESISSAKTISSLQSLHTTNFRSIIPQFNNRNHRSSLMFETVNNNEKCLNYIHQENDSTYTKNGDNENDVNEHLLQILQNVELPLDEKTSPLVQIKSE